MISVLASVLLAMPVAQQFDTTVTVRPGARLELNNFEGSVTVTTWAKAAVRIQAEPDEEDEDERGVDVYLSGNTLSIRSGGRSGAQEIDYRLTVPADMALSINGQSGDVSIDGPKGEITVETVEGEIKVNGGGGLISLRSVDGSVTLSGAKGRIDVNSVDGEISLANVSGEIHAESVDGAITMEGVESSGVDAQSVDGEISFRGTIKDGGRYRMVSHDGDVTLTVPALNATVSVSTYSGNFDSDFPATLTGGVGGKRMNFTVGTGSARLEIESFDGNVSLRKSTR
jgi:DUF4097 and DUF4098 domain-containing protein YvlB